MTYIRKAELLENVRISLSAVRTDPILSNALVELGLTAEKLAEGWSLYEAAASQPVDATTRHGDKLLATRQVKDLRRALREEYSTVVRIAKAVLIDELRFQLGVLGIAKDHPRGPKRKRRHADQPAEGEPGLEAATGPIEPEIAATATTPDATDQPDQPHRRHRQQSDSHLLYSVEFLCRQVRDTPDVAVIMAEVGYPDEELGRLEAKAAQLRAARYARDDAAVSESRTRQQHREAMAALQKWWRRFTGLTSAGLRDQPELLSKLGVKVRGRKKQTR